MEFYILTMGRIYSEELCQRECVFQPPENVITLLTSLFPFKSSQMMYGRRAPTWHTLIDRGISCGYFPHSSTPDLEYQSSAQTPPPPSRQVRPGSAWCQQKCAAEIVTDVICDKYAC